MSDRRSNRQVMLWIVLGLVAWGLYLALGDYLRNHSLLRSLVTVLCVTAFLAIWLTAMAVRRWRSGRQRETDSD
jgi:drug/metabolite transporter (DMT)-like permease